MLYRTFMIGLGGTGVEVLRKFKNHYVKYYDTEQKYLRLLGIDTAEQLESGDEKLSADEFLHLGRPPVGTSTILQYRNQPPFEWLPSDLPAFPIASGAGMRRMVGHMAYFWRGQDIINRIQSAMQALYNSSVSREFAGVADGAQTRVFIISSVCGGTGTGMFLDISYLVRNVFERLHNNKTLQFGMLFLPSTFSQLQGTPEYRNISANGYAALQELNYYMQPTFRANRMPAPMIGGMAEMPVAPPAFDLCFLLSGTNEVGQVLTASGDLYRRSAEFLFSCVAFPQIDDHIVQYFAANSPGAYSTFGSFTIPLPRARYIERYLMDMGKELLSDILDADASGTPSGAEALARFPQEQLLRDPSAMLPIADLSSRLNRDVFVHNTASTHAEATASISEEYRLWGTVRSSVTSDISVCVRDAAAGLEKALDQEKARLSTVDRGSVAALAAFWRGCQQSIDGLTAGARSYATAADATELSAFERYRQGPRLSMSSNGAPERLRQFRVDLETAAKAQLVNDARSQIKSQLNQLRARLAEEGSDYSKLLSQKDNTVAEFTSLTTRYLEFRRSETRGDHLHRAGIGDVKVPSDQYQTDRIGLLQKCRASMTLSDLLTDKRSVDLSRFLGRLYQQTAGYVVDHVAQSQLLDEASLREVAAQSLVNLRLQQAPDARLKVANVVFAPRDRALQEQLDKGLKGWTGEHPLHFADAADDSVLSFVRVVGSYELKHVAEIEEMKRAYDLRKRDPHESIFLDLPTHQRREIWSENEGAEMAAVFALGVALGVIVEFGQNYLFDSIPLLPSDEKNPVIRRKTAYTRVFGPDYRAQIRDVENRKLRELGGNAGYAVFLIDAIQRAYPGTDGADPYSQMFVAERRSLEDHLQSLGVPGMMTLRATR